MDTVSVVVPVYNVEKYLERCVQSILSQTYSNLEIILVDDGAKDSSPELCEQLARQDGRIKVVHQENRGLGGARNTGLDHATGAFVAFIDADDYIGKTHIEELYNSVVQAEADIALGFYVSVDDAGKITRKPNPLKPGEYGCEAGYNQLLFPMIGTHEGCHTDTAVEPSCCMGLYSLAIIKEHNIRFADNKIYIAEDQLFNIDCFVHARKIVATDVEDYFYYVNTQSMTRKYDAGRFDRTVNYYHLLKKKLEGHGILETAGKRPDRSFLMKMRILLRLVVFSNMSFKSKLAEIKRILSHDLFVQVITGYPIHTYPTMMKILSQFMRSQNAMGVYWLIKAREYTKKS